MADNEEDIEQPQDDPDGPELGCWMNFSRICGEDCVAYDERSIADPRFNPCIMLNVGRSIMASLAGLEKALAGQERARRNKELLDRANVPPQEVK